MNPISAQPVETQVIVADTSSIMAVIARAAADPNTDVEKLERLTNLYERITDRQAEQAYSEAMNEAQEEMRPVAADANNPQTKSKYASYAALDRALRPIYTKHGFSVSFDTGDTASADMVRVICRVGHRAGHKETPHLDMPADGKGAKGGDVMTKTHATGAALTYGRRYLLGMIFNIAVGEDDDGNGAEFRRREQSAGATAAITSLNACNTSDDLKRWKAGNADVVQTLPEADEIIRLFNQRVANLKEVGK